MFLVPLSIPRAGARGSWLLGPPWAALRLSPATFRTAKPSSKAAQLRSCLSSLTALAHTHRDQNAAQIQTLLLRQCIKTGLNYTLRTVPPSLTEQCALEHDAAFDTAIESVLACPHATVATASDMSAAICIPGSPACLHRLGITLAHYTRHAVSSFLTTCLLDMRLFFPSIVDSPTVKSHH
eukprot:4880652-Pleurochrysis_carterae.AAC.1